MKAFFTDYPKYCLFCGKPTTEQHHFIFGVANHKLADNDGIYAPLCRPCHDFIHKNGTAAKMSKIIGQLVWEENELSSKGEIKDAREKFRSRYGLSYL